jgi:DNA (cytosine-5)-methyltransferase 1
LPTVIEMFSGIGGFRLGLQGDDVNFIWANDIHRLACDAYESNFGRGSVLCDDIKNVEANIPPHDILTAGFPCQPFSQAGKKLGTADFRGTLFESIARVLRRHRPQFFILENVKRLLSMDGGIHFKTILAELCQDGYWVEWRLLNAKHFGLAQNRERVIMVGVADVPAAPMAEALERHSVLLTNEDLPSLSLSNTSHFADELAPLEGYSGKLKNWGIAHEGRVLTRLLSEMPNQRAPVPLRQILEPQADPCFDLTERTLSWIHQNTPVNQFIHGVEILSNQEGGRRMGYTIFGVGGIAPTVTSTTSRHYERYFIEGRYRRLTNVEYARLQGFPDDWCRLASVYDQYALYGNAIPPNMVQWIGSRLAGNNLRQNELAPDTLFAL